ncbi:pre-mRNA processing RNA-helicase, partial [Elasticomyces elasticus]
MIRVNVETHRRIGSERAEVVDLHYDRFHNPENCYHLELNWLTTTSKLVDDALTTWTNVAEKYGLRLVEVPIAEACEVSKTEQFRNPYTIKLAAEPPAQRTNAVLFKTAVFSASPRSTVNSSGPQLRHVYQKAILRRSNFVLDIEAVSEYPDGVDINYSWGSSTQDQRQEIAPQAQTEQPVEEEEEDPLAAFMSDLTAKPAKRTMFKANGVKGKNTPKLQEPEALFSDDDLEKVAVDHEGVGGIMAKAEEIARKKKKDIGTVNHAKVDYESFRKDFYNESIDLQDLDEEQSWAQCGLGVQALGVVHSLGFDAPTSIQAQAIPAIMSGRDVIGVAKTGSGKTIAFLLPIFRHIKDQRPIEGVDGPIGLILSPTRELATQIHKECKPFLKALGLRAVCAYGGAPIKDQIAELKRGAEIVVCTPGRMIDLLAANGGRVTNLRRITYTVLDEADRMFDMGFEPQVMKILANIRPDRQTVLFSATFPRQMDALARKTLRQPIEITVGGRSMVAPEIEQVVEVRNGPAKFMRLLELLGRLYEDDSHSDDRALIFMDRQDTADLLLRDLMKKGYPCMSIHGGKDQIDRDSTISDFKNGVVPILIATSVAARGLD